jgi:fimbrial chaperone protein
VAWAAGFSVDPIHLELHPAQTATSLTVANFNTEPLVMQARVYRWEHKDREDILTEAGSEAPLVTPPLFRLAPGGGSQVIRIGFQKPGDPPAEERQWRVIVEEVPANGPASESPGTPISIAVHVRVSVPLLQRPRSVHQDLQWTLERGTAGWVKLTAQNLGSVTERLDDVQLGSTDDKNSHIGGPLYLFPGERRTFELHPTVALAGGNVRLSVQGTPRPPIALLVLSAQ